jgi:hypothetical protein
MESIKKKTIILIAILFILCGCLGKQEQNELKSYGIIPLDRLTESKSSDIPIIKEAFDKQYKQYYLRELESDNCYLGCPLEIYELGEKEIKNFSSKQTIQDQMVTSREYLFPVIDKDVIIADFQTSVNKKGQVDVALGGNRFPLVYEALKQNHLSLDQCYLVTPIHGPLFLFSKQEDQEICTNVHPNFAKTLIMNESNTRIFKDKITLLKEMLKSNDHYNDSDPNVPLLSPAEFYDIWYE